MRLPLAPSSLALCAVSAISVLSLAACQRQAPDAAPLAAAEGPAASAPATDPAGAASLVIEPSEAQRTLAERQGKLEYAIMEDGHLNDPKGQWASAAKASSSSNEAQAPADPKESRAWRVTGEPDGNTWSQAKQDIGMDWIQLTYDRPVHAEAVRVVLRGAEAVEAITKVEVLDQAGVAQTVWSGLSDVKRDPRGDRTWFERTFARTDAPIVGVKVTFANNVASGFKEVDAVQLVGE